MALDTSVASLKNVLCERRPQLSRLLLRVLRAGRELHDTATLAQCGLPLADPQRPCVVYAVERPRPQPDPSPPQPLNTGVAVGPAAPPAPFVLRLAACLPGDVAIALWLGQVDEQHALLVLRAAQSLLQTMNTAHIRQLIRGLDLPPLAAHAACVAALSLRNVVDLALCAPLLPALARAAQLQWNRPVEAALRGDPRSDSDCVLPPAWAEQIRADMEAQQQTPMAAPVFSPQYMSSVPVSRRKLYPQGLGMALVQAARVAGVREAPALAAARHPGLEQAYAQLTHGRGKKKDE